MPSGQLLILVSLLTSHRSASRDQSKIKIALRGYYRDYSAFSCNALCGLIQGVDRLVLSGNLIISGFNSSFNATFGLLSLHDTYIRLATEIDSSSCPQPSEVNMDTCVCTYLDINELRFMCNLTASCKMSENMYFYMNYNNTYYYTDSIHNLQTYVRCEEPPGPFSLCVNGQEKRTVTYPFDPARARYSCMSDLVDGVDRFNMSGKIDLGNISNSSTVFVSFAVALENNSRTFTFLGTAINLYYRECLPLERNVINSCGCVGVEQDGFHVVCTLLASLKLSQKFGFFQLNVDGQDYFGDYVRMPLVLDKCKKTEMSFLERLMYITVIVLLVLTTGILLYVFLSNPGYIAAHIQCSPKAEQVEIIPVQSNVERESCVDGSDIARSDKGSYRQSAITSNAEAEMDFYEFRRSHVYYETEL